MLKYAKKITFINSNKHILAEYDEKYVLKIGPNSTLRGPTPLKMKNYDIFFLSKNLPQ